jgi:hypothetical protein
MESGCRSYCTSPSGKSLREFILSALGGFLAARNELLRDLITYEFRLAEAPAGEESGSIQTAIRETIQDLERVDRHIELLTGEATPVNFSAYSGRSK